MIEGFGTATIDYEYDLISGNMKKVSYNKDKIDQFYHRYTYHADNRLFTVATSIDNKLYKQDALYKYYPHGPLQRVELGDKVKGLDYIYTLQGWLKGINIVNGIATKNVTIFVVILVDTPPLNSFLFDSILYSRKLYLYIHF